MPGHSSMSQPVTVGKSMQEPEATGHDPVQKLGEMKACLLLRSLPLLEFYCVHLLCVHLWVHACKSTCVEVRGHLVDVSSLFLPCGSWGPNSGPGRVTSAFTHSASCRPTLSALPQSRSQTQGMVLPIVGWVFPHQLIKLRQSYIDLRT